jgi:hypothetical protein
VWLVVIAAGVAAVCVGVLLYILYDEGDRVYLSRMYRAKSEIAALEIAVKSQKSRFRGECQHFGTVAAGAFHFSVRSLPGHQQLSGVRTGVPQRRG